GYSSSSRPGHPIQHRGTFGGHILEKPFDQFDWLLCYMETFRRCYGRDLNRVRHSGLDKKRITFAGHDGLLVAVSVESKRRSCCSRAFVPYKRNGVHVEASVAQCGEKFMVVVETKPEHREAGFF